MIEQLKALLGELDTDFAAVQAEKQRVVAEAQSRIAQLDDQAGRIRKRWETLQALLQEQSDESEES